MISPDRLKNYCSCFSQILELVKQNLIKTDQDVTFGDIILTPEQELFTTDEAGLQIEEI